MPSQILIRRDGQQVGPYPEKLVRDYLREGTLSPTDMAWDEGRKAWVRLGDMVDAGIPMPRLEAPPPPRAPIGMYIGLGVGLTGLLIAIGVLFFLLLSMEQKGPAPLAETTEPSDFSEIPDYCRGMYRCTDNWNQADKEKLVLLKYTGADAAKLLLLDVESGSFSHVKLKDPADDPSTAEPVPDEKVDLSQILIKDSSVELTGKMKLDEQVTTVPLNGSPTTTTASRDAPIFCVWIKGRDGHDRIILVIASSNGSPQVQHFERIP